jgi:hypothetical protein
VNKALILLPVLLLQFLAASVVINEVCYDPEGSDTGKEWIELYNAGSSEVNLNGCKIYSGGSSYNLNYVFPHFILRPGRFVLVGGDAVPNTHFTHNFSFQNGGSESDAIRFVNADSTYTDTVIYDEPNSNALIDDSGLPATSFAMDVPAGSSLARISDGYDTDDCATDFYAEANPTPGAPNRIYADYGISSAMFTQLQQAQLLSLWIVNHSQYSPAAYAMLRVTQEAELLYDAEIAPIAAKDSLYLEVLLNPSWQPLEINIELPDDPNPANNTVLLSPFAIDLKQPIINEVMAAPLPGKQEWLEVFQEAVPRNAANYVIRDASGTRTRFTLPALPGYFVICANAEAFLLDYPSCPANRVIQSSGWAILNNTGDELYLYDEEELELLDAMAYTEQQIQNGKSLERHLDHEQNVIWRVSIHPDGASPAAENTLNILPPQTQRLKLSGSPIDARQGESLTISFNLPDDPSRVNCYIFDLSGRKISTLADNSQVSARGNLFWDGRKQGGSYAQRGLYIVLWESQAASGGNIYRRQTTAVVK